MSEHRCPNCGEDAEPVGPPRKREVIPLDGAMWRSRAEKAEAELLDTSFVAKQRDAALAQVEQLVGDVQAVTADYNAALARVKELEDCVAWRRASAQAEARIAELEKQLGVVTKQRDTANAQRVGQFQDMARQRAELEGALRDVLETAASCRCEEAWTGRGLHAPECHYDEVGEARAVLEKSTRKEGEQ